MRKMERTAVGKAQTFDLLTRWRRLICIVNIPFSHVFQIHTFIKEGVSQPKHRGTGYLKVKVEDDTINLPREANREYIY